MNQYFAYIKFVVLTAILAAISYAFLQTYQTYVKNQAIDGCYAQSLYQVETTENNRTITTRETQKWVYDQCLAAKGITLPASK